MISIIDGRIFLEMEVVCKGIQPAVNGVSP